MQNLAEFGYSMIPVYLASPYSGNVERNTAYLRDAIRHSVSLNESPYASHRMLTDALDDGNANEREIGQCAGLTYISLVNFIVVYIDLGISSGMKAEIDFANSKNKLVILRCLTEWAEVRTEQASSMICEHYAQEFTLPARECPSVAPPR